MTHSLRDVARAVLLILLLALAACADPGPATAPPTTDSATAPPTDDNVTRGCVDEHTDGRDYFPDKATFDHASGVSVSYEETYKVVEVTPLEGEEPLRYVLHQCGTPEPELVDDLQDATVVTVPVGDVISLTTTNLPHFALLERADSVVGVGTSTFVTTPEIVERVEDGDIDDFATAEGQTNTEAVIGAQPDLVIMDAFGESIVEEAQRLVETGVPAVLNADFNEQELLGRAEWLKFTALFLNEEAAATASFDEIADSYDDVVAAAEQSDQRPTVFVNTPIEGTWFTPGGNSYFAAALEDANAEYVFGDDDSTYSLELDIETVLDAAADADVWLQAGSVNGTLRDLLRIDERFREFEAFRTGQVWAYDKAVTPGGGNAVFETAYTRADVFLSDLVKILHPEALPDHELVFFGQVPRKR